MFKALQALLAIAIKAATTTVRAGPQAVAIAGKAAHASVRGADLLAGLAVRGSTKGWWAAFRTAARARYEANQRAILTTITREINSGRFVSSLSARAKLNAELLARWAVSVFPEAIAVGQLGAAAALLTRQETNHPLTSDEEASVAALARNMADVIAADPVLAEMSSDELRGAMEKVQSALDSEGSVSLTGPEGRILESIVSIVRLPMFVGKNEFLTEGVADALQRLYITASDTELLDHVQRIDEAVRRLLPIEFSTVRPLYDAATTCGVSPVATAYVDGAGETYLLDPHSPQCDAAPGWVGEHAGEPKYFFKKIGKSIKKLGKTLGKAGKGLLSSPLVGTALGFVPGGSVIAGVASSLSQSKGASKTGGRPPVTNTPLSPSDHRPNAPSGDPVWMPEFSAHTGRVGQPLPASLIPGAEFSNMPMAGYEYERAPTTGATTVSPASVAMMAPEGLSTTKSVWETLKEVGLKAMGAPQKRPLPSPALQERVNIAFQKVQQRLTGLDAPLELYDWVKRLPAEIETVMDHCRVVADVADQEAVDKIYSNIAENLEKMAA